MCKVISCLLMVALLATLCSCKTFRFADYVRTYDNEARPFHFVKDSAGQVKTYDDTIVCKIIVRAGVVWEQHDKNYNIFYYETPCHPDTAYRDIFTYDLPLSQISFYFVKGALYMGEIRRERNPMSGFSRKVIPKRVKPGKVYTYKSGDFRKTFTFLKPEDIYWGKRPIKNALKIAIGFTSREGFKSTDTIWLAKKWGWVRWKKADGYTGYAPN